MNSLAIRRLSPGDATEYRRVRLQGLRRNPEAFGSSHGEEARRPLALFARRLARSGDLWTFGAWVDGRLAGVVTLQRHERRKERHKASILGLYVEERFRRRGVGRALLARVLATAGRMRGLRRLRISVIAGNDPARRLYEGCGFRVYGREEESLFVGGRYHAELLLARNLPTRPARSSRWRGAAGRA